MLGYLITLTTVTPSRSPWPTPS